MPKAVADLAAALQAARFGVAVWSAVSLDELTIEMLCGLIDDLNTATRFTGLPLAPGDNALGVLQACGWMTGFPLRTGFGRGFPEHDPVALRCGAAGRRAARPIARCGSRPTAQQFPTGDDIPTIVLAAEPAQSRYLDCRSDALALDHDTVEHDTDTGTLVAREASRRSDTPIGRRGDRTHRSEVAWSLAVLTRIAGGRVIDPAHGRDGIGDVWMRDGRIVDAATPAVVPTRRTM